MNNNDNNSKKNAVELFHGGLIDMKSQVSAGVLNKKKCYGSVPFSVSVESILSKAATWLQLTRLEQNLYY